MTSVGEVTLLVLKILDLTRTRRVFSVMVLFVVQTL